MSAEVKIGICKHCGKTAIVDLPETATDKDANHRAALTCDCDGGARERLIADIGACVNRITANYQCSKEIKQYCGDRIAEALCIMAFAAQDGMIDGCVVNITPIDKVTIKATSYGVKIRRREIREKEGENRDE